MDELATTREKLAKAMKENQRMQQQLRWKEEELRIWKEHAILFTDEEIFAFYKSYREKQYNMRREKERKTMEAIDKLMLSVKEN